MKVGFFRPLYGHVGDYVSVYLDTAGADENVPDEVCLRWRAARQRLAESGVEAGTLNAIEAVVTDPARAAPGRALFARDGRVTFTAPLGAPPRREIARLGQLPHLMPLLAQRPPSAPHLRVAGGEAGGENVAVHGSGEAGSSPESRRGWPVHKAAAEGRSQARHQRSTLVLDHLTAPFQPRAAGVEREVAADSPAMRGAVGHSITALADRECRARFGEWQVRRTQSGTVEGLAATLAALRDGRVADLFIADRPASAGTVWIGPDGTDLAASAAELRERGVQAPARERADAAVVRALAATDAELHFLPEDLIMARAGGRGGIGFPPDGICATLRWGEGS
jgi:hypothetical protein